MGILIKDFYQGETRDIPFIFTDEAKNLLSVEGAALYFTVKQTNDKREDDEEALLKIVAQGSEPDLENLSGRILLSLSKEDTTQASGKYNYDLRFRYFLDDEEKIATLETGVLKIKPAITREFSS